MFATRRRLFALAAASTAFYGLQQYARAQGGPPRISHAQLEADPYLSEVPAYGALKRDPAGLFDLPEGFEYTVVSRAGDVMDDGFVTPHKTDGMACFAFDGDRVVLTRNHEVKTGDDELSAYGPGRRLAATMPRDKIYDRDARDLPLGGGVTTLVYDIKTRQLVRHHLSLTGTTTNCAGGKTDWGSWLSCEETLQRKGEGGAKDHGYVFEVPSALAGVADPLPITGLGRFRHEAAVVDPRTGVVYLTEDEGDGFGLFYRFLPNDRRKLHAGGRLQALALPEGADADPRNWQAAYWAVGDRRPVRWIDVDGVDNPNNDLRYRGHAKGAAWFARGEGLFVGNGELFFACTSGGPKAGGQIMRYRPSPSEGQAGEADQPGELSLFVEAVDSRLMNMCDNITISPWGHLIVCEDRIGGINYLRGVTPEGKVYTLGRNAHAGDGDVGENSELAGACFSPDGTTLFVNIYAPGMTIAITGPWGRFKAA